jgi:hypothetical protein
MSISNRELDQLLGSDPSSGSQTPPQPPELSRQPQLYDDPDRLAVDDHRAEAEASKACGTGSNYNNMPILQGDENWAEWDDALQTAAMGEHVHKLLSDTFTPPGSQPGADTPTRIWNHWVKAYQWHKRQNDNLLAGIKRFISPYMRDKIKGILNARTAYDRLKSECQQRGASIVGDIVSKLLIDTAPNYRNIRDFSRAFLSRIDQLDRMALPWKVPEELLQIWYLHNLGDSFHNFRSSIYQHFKVAGLGEGQALTLRNLMERAGVEYNLQTQDQRPSGNPGAFFNQTPGTKRPFNQALGRGGRSAPPAKKPYTKKTKPANYKGPHQKVCSHHGWWNNSGNHDDSDCRYLLAKKVAAYQFDLTSGNEDQEPEPEPAEPMDSSIPMEEYEQDVPDFQDSSHYNN